MARAANAIAPAPPEVGVEPLISVEGVGRRYRVGDNVVVALADVSLEVAPRSSSSCSGHRGVARPRC
jgi:hypothetical protein